MKAAAVMLGLLMLAVPALSSPAQALAVTGAGVLLLTASLITRSGWSAPAGTLAAAVAVIQCAVSGRGPWAWPPRGCCLVAI